MGRTPELQVILNKLSELEKKIDSISPIIPQGKCYTSKQVQELLQINVDTLSRMRAENLIVYKRLSDFSFRYPVDQPIFKTTKGK